MNKFWIKSVVLKSVQFGTQNICNFYSKNGPEKSLKNCTNFTLKTEVLYPKICTSGPEKTKQL